MISPIQVRSHHLRHVLFSQTGSRPETAKLHCEVKLHHSPREEEQHWDVLLRVELRIEDKDGKLPDNKIEVEFDGIFFVASNYPKEGAEDIVRMNGGAVLYGAARELVHQLSARSQYGAFELPTIDARVFLNQKPVKNTDVAQ